MAKPLKKPAYQRHTGTGQARVKINGKDHYLGTYGSTESKERYDQLIAEWFDAEDSAQVGLRVEDLCLCFIKFAEKEYRHKDGTPTGEVTNLRHALKFLVRRHGRCLLKEFGPKKLVQVRETMISAGLCRTNINRMVHRIRRAFKWGIANEMVKPSAYEALRAVSALRAGRTDAAESDPVKPVEQSKVDATLPFLSPIVRDMVRLQQLCGMRPTEACSIRPCDLTVSVNDVLVYQPAQHKTQHRGKDRRIPIGPEGRKILEPYLKRDPESFCFSPREAESARNATKKRNRRSPMTPSQATRTPFGKQFRDRYTKDSYNRAVQRACEKAFGMPAELRYVNRAVERTPGISKSEATKLKEKLNAEAAVWRADNCWSPNQLRHSAATLVRSRYGIEAAQAVLSHSSPKTTEIYAERDFATAVKIMQEIG